MLKEYSTIREVVGPLMLVEGVNGVKYDELVEIEQANGEIAHGPRAGGQRRSRHVAAVRKFAGPEDRYRQGAVSGQVHRACGFHGYAGPRVRRHGPAPGRRAGNHPEMRLDMNGAPINPAQPRLSRRVYPDRYLRDRRPEYAGSRPEAAGVLRQRPAPRQPGRADRPPGEGADGRQAITSPWCSARSASRLRKPTSLSATSAARAPSTAPCCL